MNEHDYRKIREEMKERLRKLRKRNRKRSKGKTITQLFIRFKVLHLLLDTMATFRKFVQ